MHPIIQGIILGFIIVLPGMSGGTVFVILGIYENMVKDLVKFHIKPYLPLIVGMVAGIFLGGMAFAMFFESYRDYTVAFLLGCLLASVKSVLNDCPGLNGKRFVALFFGTVAGFYMVGEPIELITKQEDVQWFILIIGGALSSAAMIIPGIPGSSVLIILGIYDNILRYIKEINLLKLSIYGLGCIAGVILLLNLLEKIYDRYRVLLSYSFAGLILGSSRALLPYVFNLPILLLFMIGFLLVWIWSTQN